MNKRNENTQMGQSLLLVLHERFVRAASKDIVVTSYNLSGITPDLPHEDVLGELAGLILDGAISMMETKGSDDRWMSFNAILYKGELKLACHCGMGFDEKNTARFFRLDRLREIVAGIGGQLEWDEWGDTLVVSVCLPCGGDMESIEAEKKEPGVILRLRHDLRLNNIDDPVGGSSILLVDDNPGIMEMVSSVLIANDCIVTECPTLEKARGILREIIPSLILLGGNLPDGSGFDFCRELRTGYGYAGPILLHTVLGGNDNIMAGYRAGCTDYLVKPFDLDILMVKVCAYLRTV